MSPIEVQLPRAAAQVHGARERPGCGRRPPMHRPAGSHACGDVGADSLGSFGIRCRAADVEVVDPPPVLGPA